jgi:hypothetical protein
MDVSAAVIAAVEVAIALWNQVRRRKMVNRKVLDPAILAECRANLVRLEALGVGARRPPLTEDCWRTVRKLRNQTLCKTMDTGVFWACYQNCGQYVARSGRDPVPLADELRSVRRRIDELRAKAALGPQARAEVLVAVRLANLHTKLAALVVALE